MNKETKISRSIYVLAFVVVASVIWSSFISSRPAQTVILQSPNEQVPEVVCHISDGHTWSRKPDAISTEKEKKGEYDNSNYYPLGKTLSCSRGKEFIGYWVEADRAYYGVN